MTLIIDASVALKWFMEEQGSSIARSILDRDESLAAPDLIIVETCNGVWKAVRQQLMTAAQADMMAHQLPRLFNTLHPAAPLASTALVIARRLEHPVYDCFYLALAVAREATMVTADKRLIARVSGTEWQGRVVLLADYGLVP